MNDPFRSALASALEAQGGKVDEELDGDRVRVWMGGRSYVVSMDNIRRRVQMGDALEATVAEFVTALPGPPPEVGVATRRTGLRLMLEQVSVIEGTETVHRNVSPEVAISLVWIDDPESRIRFVQRRLLAEWQLDEEEAWRTGAGNMDRLLAASPLVHPIRVSPQPRDFPDLGLWHSIHRTLPAQTRLSDCLKGRLHSPVTGKPALRDQQQDCDD